MRKKIWFLVFSMMITSGVFSQPDTLVSPADTIHKVYYELFLDIDPYKPEEPLRIEIEFDYKDFLQRRFQDTALLANISVYDRDSLLYSESAQIRARGESRKKICLFPPFELNIKKSGREKDFTEEMHKLKVVTQCRNNKLNEQYLLKEYLCYKLNNLLTDYSYKVRIVEIKFTDIAGKIKPYTNYGFIIETNSHLSERISAYPVEVMGIRSSLTDYNAYHLMVVFQYMIGNTDWDVPSLHNIRLFKLQDVHKLNPVPITYDFDYAGIVNADYAVPLEKFGTTSVRERIYMGYCIPENEFIKVFNAFKEKEDQFNNLINNCPGLDKYNKTDMLRYMSEFFDIIKNPKIAKSIIMDKCMDEQ